jgi:hypothetical protein
MPGGNMPSTGNRLAEDPHGELQRLLAEPDPERLLDSMECLVVLAFVERNGVAVGRAPLTDYPATINAWVEWLAR